MIIYYKINVQIIITVILQIEEYFLLFQIEARKTLFKYPCAGQTKDSEETKQ